MAIVLASNWWAIALRGVAGIVFGYLALLVPGAAIAALVIVFGALRAGHRSCKWLRQSGVRLVEVRAA